MNSSALMPKVLVIDDEPQIRRLLRFTLEADGHVVKDADNGQTGLIEAAGWRPEIIILDLGLPDIPGLEVLKRLREWTKAAGYWKRGQADAHEKIED